MSRQRCLSRKRLGLSLKFSQEVRSKDADFSTDPMRRDELKERILTFRGWAEEMEPVKKREKGMLEK